MNRPAFLITIDTEGDNLWERPREITCRNAEYLPRFQSLCERFGFCPTYLTNFEMATSGAFIEFGKEVLRNGTGEIGMHLHAWNSPPVEPLTADDFEDHPYLMEYPEAVMRTKIGVMTDLLEDTFQIKMLSHRAGRWGFDEVYARLLVERGYQVDCSVTPHVSWRSASGVPGGRGGADFTQFPDHEYLVDLSDISREGTSSLLELPMTIIASRVLQAAPWLYENPSIARVVRRIAPPVHWLRPNGRNMQPMLSIVDHAIHDKKPYIEFMLHSSEFMPGGSPTFHGDSQIETLYSHLEELFERIGRHFVGMTLRDYYAMTVLPPSA